MDIKSTIKKFFKKESIKLEDAIKRDLNRAIFDVLNDYPVSKAKVKVDIELKPKEDLEIEVKIKE